MTTHVRKLVLTAESEYDQEYMAALAELLFLRDWPRVPSRRNAKRSGRAGSRRTIPRTPRASSAP